MFYYLNFSLTDRWGRYSVLLILGTYYRVSFGSNLSPLFFLFSSKFGLPLLSLTLLVQNKVLIWPKYGLFNKQNYTFSMETQLWRGSLDLIKL